MFNSSLKNDALAIHQKEVDKYNNAYETMIISCDRLYQKRLSSVDCSKSRANERDGRWYGGSCEKRKKRR